MPGLHKEESVTGPSCVSRPLGSRSDDDVVCAGFDSGGARRSDIYSLEHRVLLGGRDICVPANIYSTSSSIASSTTRSPTTSFSPFFLLALTALRCIDIHVDRLLMKQARQSLREAVLHYLHCVNHHSSQSQLLLTQRRLHQNKKLLHRNDGGGGIIEMDTKISPRAGGPYVAFMDTRGGAGNITLIRPRDGSVYCNSHTQSRSQSESYFIYEIRGRHSVMHLRHATRRLVESLYAAAGERADRRTVMLPHAFAKKGTQARGKSPRTFEVGGPSFYNKPQMCRWLDTVRRRSYEVEQEGGQHRNDTEITLSILQAPNRSQKVAPAESSQPQQQKEPATLEAVEKCRNETDKTDNNTSAPPAGKKRFSKKKTTQTSEPVARDAAAEKFINAIEMAPSLSEIKSTEPTEKAIISPSSFVVIMERPLHRGSSPLAKQKEQEQKSGAAVTYVCVDVHGESPDDKADILFTNQGAATTASSSSSSSASQYGHRRSATTAGGRGGVRSQNVLDAIKMGLMLHYDYCGNPKTNTATSSRDGLVSDGDGSIALQLLAARDAFFLQTAAFTFAPTVVLKSMFHSYRYFNHLQHDPSECQVNATVITDVDVSRLSDNSGGGTSQCKQPTTHQVSYQHPLSKLGLEVSSRGGGGQDTFNMYKTHEMLFRLRPPHPLQTALRRLVSDLSQHITGYPLYGGKVSGKPAHSDTPKLLIACRLPDGIMTPPTTFFGTQNVVSAFYGECAKCEPQTGSPRKTASRRPFLLPITTMPCFDWSQHNTHNTESSVRHGEIPVSPQQKSRSHNTDASLEMDSIDLVPSIADIKNAASERREPPPPPPRYKDHARSTLRLLKSFVPLPQDDHTPLAQYLFVYQKNYDRATNRYDYSFQVRQAAAKNSTSLLVGSLLPSTTTTNDQIAIGGGGTQRSNNRSRDEADNGLHSDFFSSANYLTVQKIYGDEQDNLVYLGGGENTQHQQQPGRDTTAAKGGNAKSGGPGRGRFSSSKLAQSSSGSNNSSRSNKRFQTTTKSQGTDGKHKEHSPWTMSDLVDEMFDRQT